MSSRLHRGSETAGGNAQARLDCYPASWREIARFSDGQFVRMLRRIESKDASPVPLLRTSCGHSTNTARGDVAWGLGRP